MKRVSTLLAIAIAAASIAIAVYAQTQSATQSTFPPASSVWPYVAGIVVAVGSLLGVLLQSNSKMSRFEIESIGDERERVWKYMENQLRECNERCQLWADECRIAREGKAIAEEKAARIDRYNLELQETLQMLRGKIDGDR